MLLFPRAILSAYCLVDSLLQCVMVLVCCGANSVQSAGTSEPEKYVDLERCPFFFFAMLFSLVTHSSPGALDKCFPG